MRPPPLDSRALSRNERRIGSSYLLKWILQKVLMKLHLADYGVHNWIMPCIRILWNFDNDLNKRTLRGWMRKWLLIWNWGCYWSKIHLHKRRVPPSASLLIGWPYRGDGRAAYECDPSGGSEQVVTLFIYLKLLNKVNSNMVMIVMIIATCLLILNWLISQYE